MFLLAPGFYIINCNSGWIKTKSNHFSQSKEKASLSDYSNSDQDSTRGKNVASSAITTTSTTVTVKYSIASLISKVEPFITLPKYFGSFKKTSVARKEKKRKQAEKLEDFFSYRWKSRCLFMLQVNFQANTGLQLA